MPRFGKCFGLLLLGTLFPLAFPAFGEEPSLYEVEAIIVAHEPPPLDAEDWPEEPGSPELKGVFDVLSQRSSTAGFRVLQPKDYRLRDMAQRLEASDHYRILAHAAWRQPGLPPEKALPIKFERQLEPLTETSASPATHSTDAVPQDGRIISAFGEPQPAARLEGILRLVRSRYLHLEVDFVYYLPTSVEEEVYPAMERSNEGFQDPLLKDASQPLAWLQGYRLEESRRIRTGQIHYFDHPLFGLIVMVTPFDRNATGTSP